MEEPGTGKPLPAFHEWRWLALISTRYARDLDDGTELDRTRVLLILYTVDSQVSVADTRSVRRRKKAAWIMVCRVFAPLWVSSDCAVKWSSPRWVYFSLGPHNVANLQELSTVAVDMASATVEEGMTPSTQNHHIKTPPSNKPTPSIPSSRARTISIPRCHTPKSTNASRLRFPTLTKKDTTWTQMRTAKTCPNTSKRRRQPIGLLEQTQTPQLLRHCFYPFSRLGDQPQRGVTDNGGAKKSIHVAKHAMKHHSTKIIPSSPP